MWYRELGERVNGRVRDGEIGRGIMKERGEMEREEGRERGREWGEGGIAR